MWVTVYLASLGPRIVQQIVDRCVVGGDTAALLKLLFTMLTVYMVNGISNFAHEFTSDCISSLNAKEMRKDVYRCIMGQDQTFFRDNNPGELMSRTKQDIESLSFTMGFIGLYGIQLVFQVGYMTFCLIRYNLIGAIPALCIMPIIGAIAIIAEPKSFKLEDQRSDNVADLNKVAGESLSGIRTVKAFGREKKEENRFDNHNHGFRHLSQKIDFLWANWESPMLVAARVMIALAILAGGSQVIAGKITLGDLTAITNYTSELSWPMMDLGWILAEVAGAKAGLKKISKILDRAPELKDGDIHLTEKSGDLEFDHVCYEAGGQKILDDISFHLKPGKTLGIMGSTGSGKTIITSLAMRYMDPTSGRVMTNGISLKDMDIKSARSSKAIVTQDIFLFSDTIKANLEKGQKGKLSEEVMLRSAKDANADEFISKLSEGYDTVIGEKGVGLSGGQKQRVAIARAFASERPLLIFDDATSALDMETEKEVQKAIKHRKDHTLMIIAHRISAVRNADEIIVLEKGKIAERGTHEELLAKKGLYYQTYITQYPDEVEVINA